MSQPGGFYDPMLGAATGQPPPDPPAHQPSPLTEGLMWGAAATALHYGNAALQQRAAAHAVQQLGYVPWRIKHPYLWAWWTVIRCVAAIGAWMVVAQLIKNAWLAIYLPLLLPIGCAMIRSYLRAERQYTGQQRAGRSPRRSGKATGRREHRAMVLLGLAVVGALLCQLLLPSH